MRSLWGRCTMTPLPSQMPDEVWRPIQGYEGLYEVSNLGNMACVRRGKRRNLKISPNNSGYGTVKLFKNNKGRTFRAHRIVAIAFISAPDCPSKLEVNHKNHNRLDNCVVNLEWCNRRANASHAHKKKLSGIRKCRNRWQGLVHHNGKSVHLGTFDTPEEAHNSYLQYLKNHNLENQYAKQ